MCVGAAAAADKETVRLADDMTRDTSYPADIDIDVEQQVIVSEDNAAPCDIDVSTDLQRHAESSYKEDNGVSSHENAEVIGNVDSLPGMTLTSYDFDTGVVISQDHDTGVVTLYDVGTGIMTSRDNDTDVIMSRDDDTSVLTSYDDDTGITMSRDDDTDVIVSRDDDTNVVTSCDDDLGVVTSYDDDKAILMSQGDDAGVMTSRDVDTEQTEQLSDGEQTTVVTDMQRDVMRPLDNVIDESDSSSHDDSDASSHGNDSGNIVETGCQGDVDNEAVICQGDIGGQIKGDSHSSSQGDLEFQGDSDHGDRQLMTSQPEFVTSVTSRRVEHSEVTEDDGIVVTTTYQVGSSDPRHVS